MLFFECNYDVIIIEKGGLIVITQMSCLQMPNWLLEGSFSFSIDKILRDSLYYPCSGTDGDPVKHFMGNIFSFIYADYGVSQENLLKEMKTQGFQGYHVIHSQSIFQKELIPRGWNTYIAPGANERNPNEQFYKDWIQEPFCKWFIFERENDKDDSWNPKRFSLLYLCADAAAAYQALYLSNKITPKVICIIQPGHGFGGNWTDFTDKNSIFARSVMYSSNRPEYLVNGGYSSKENYKNPIWNEYAQHVCWLPKTDGGNLNLWKYNKANIFRLNSST